MKGVIESRGVTRHKGMKDERFTFGVESSVGNRDVIQSRRGCSILREGKGGFMEELPSRPH